MEPNIDNVKIIIWKLVSIWIFLKKKNLYCFENKNKNHLTKQALKCYKNVVDIIIIVAQFVKLDFENMNLVMCSIHTTYIYIYIYISILWFLETWK